MCKPEPVQGLCQVMRSNGPRGRNKCSVRLQVWLATVYSFDAVQVVTVGHHLVHYVLP